MQRAVKRLLRALIAPAIAIAALTAVDDARAQGIQPPHSQPYLFFNYYQAPNPMGGVGAAMYPAPNTTIPPRVGHTYITYQPLSPHEMMYCHGRTYYRYHPGAGYTKAKVLWW
jgi:hypothetical protein